MPTPRPTATVLALAAAFLIGVLLLSPPPAVGLSSGANPGFAGDMTRADGSVVTCTTCHNSSELNAGPGEVAVDAPATAAPGSRVPITVTLDPAALQAGGLQGFQATVRDPETGDLWGTLHLTEAADTRFSSAAEGYVTHTTAGTARSSWTFDWAPGTDRSGTARVYVAGNAANNDGGTAGDDVYTATADVAVAPVAQAPGPAQAFEVGRPRPHPVRAGGDVRLDVTLGRPGALRVRLVDGLGRTVRDADLGERGAGVESVRFETAGLAAGVYGVVVDGPGGRRSRSLVVVR